MLVSDNSAVVFGLFVIAEETKYTHIAWQYKMCLYLLKACFSICF
jgi:hypothetical protein